MSTKNFLTPTRRYKYLISSIHSIYRLVNSTYELKDLVSRLTRLLCQIFNVESCLILLLDNTKKYSLLKCQVSKRKRIIIDKKLKIANGLERRILKTLT